MAANGPQPMPATAGAPTLQPPSGQALVAGDSGRWSIVSRERLAANEGFRGHRWDVDDDQASVNIRRLNGNRRVGLPVVRGGMAASELERSTSRSVSRIDVLAGEMTSAQTALLGNLNALRGAVAAAPVIGSILDDEWFETVERAIRTDSCSKATPADPSGFLYDFCHRLRGVDWFERNQDLAQAGRLGEVSAHGQLAIALEGLDPLKTILPVIESRLDAFAALPFKQATVQVKLRELRAARMAPAFKNHLFELNVLGDLALRHVLVDIEDGATGVDGVVRIDGRDILVEATNTVQRVIPDFTGAFFVKPDVEINQVIAKVQKKVADGRQLARANGKPTLLFLARTHMGAGRDEADAALTECFRQSDFSALSGVVLADSYRLHVTSWRPGAGPDVPLNENELARLAEWYALT